MRPPEPAFDLEEHCVSGEIDDPPMSGDSREAQGRPAALVSSNALLGSPPPGYDPPADLPYVAFFEKKAWKSTW
jgi:hypothetical protein